MIWQMLKIFILCALMWSCSHKTTHHLESREGYTHWGEKVVSMGSGGVMVDCVFVAPMCSPWGDSMTIPPNPPAPSFHYVCLSESAPHSAPTPMPIYVRKRIQMTNIVRHDSVATAGNKRIMDDHHESVSKSRSHWWVYVLIFLLVDIIGLFVYFIWRFGRKSLTLR